MSIVEFDSAAASRTTPDPVTQERSFLGERKNTNAACEVCVSSISANHSWNRSHTSLRRCSSSMREVRIRKSSADGGVPARAESRATSTSRRENAL